MTLRFFRLSLRVLMALNMLLLAGAALGQAPQVRVRRTYYDYAGQQLHEEYQYIQTAGTRYCKHGYYKEYDEEGVLWKKGSYRHNQAEGRQLEYLNVSGQPQLQYDITVRHGVAHGPYTRYKGPGEKMSAGSYVNGSREGTWKFYYSDVYEVCTYEHDQKQGRATLYYKNGQVAERYAYRNDERYNDGAVENFYEDGSPKKSGYFTEGRMNGKFLAWYPNGQLRYEEHYVQGQNQGQVLAYDEAGNVLTNDLYEAGVLVRHEKSAQEIAEEARQEALERQRHRAKVQLDSIQQVERQARVAREAAEASQLKARDMAREAALQQALLLQIGSGQTSPGAALLAYRLRRRPQPRLYVSLYARLLAEYEAATEPTDRLTRAEHLLKLIELTLTLAEGNQKELSKAIGKEDDLDKVRALTGL